MSLKSIIPFTAAKARKGHVKYLHRLARGHDVLLSVEWGDGELTYLPADLRPEMDGWYEATNGLLFAPIGEGTEPVSHLGVDVVRVSAQIACPIDTVAALEAELDEAGDYDIVEDDDGRTERVIEYETVDDPRESGPTASETNGHDGDVAADGGGRMQVKREYDLRPPAPAVGWTFGMDQVEQRAPHAVSPNMLQRAKEYGEEIAFGEGSRVRDILMGMGVMLGILIVLAIVAMVFLNVTGGGGGGGGGSSSGENLNLLWLAAAPAGHGLRKAVGGARDRVAAMVGGE